MTFCGPSMNRRGFLATVAAGALGSAALPTVAAEATQRAPSFGKYRICYDNFAAHLLNAYNPNVFYPKLPYRWRDSQWRAMIDMLADFGFNVFQYWLPPRLFCRDGLSSEAGREFTRQMNELIAYAKTKSVRVHGFMALATVGPDWITLCPNKSDDWAELRRLWDAWTRRLPEQDIWGIFPGDPGGCSRHGCTAMTFIDRALEIAQQVRQNCPRAKVELNTWGPPFFGWGNIQAPPDWQGEFDPALVASAWSSTQQRTAASMTHLVKRLPEFPSETLVSLNLGFNPDGIPEGSADARMWAREIAKTNDALTWDFSLTEGENAIVPHGRFRRLFGRRLEERTVGAYSGGICFTMTPMLNQCSLYCSAQSFQRPDADPLAVAGEFFAKLYGPEGAQLGRYLPLFELVRDWGCHVEVLLDKDAYHERMQEMVTILNDLRPSLRESMVLHPSPVKYHAELHFFAELFRDLSGPNPDFEACSKAYWNRVYAIYNELPAHVDPRPRHATNSLVNTFRKNWPATRDAQSTAWTRG